VILLCFREDDQVVKEGEARDADEGAKDVIHEAHEGGRAVGQAERKNSKFEAPHTSVEGGQVHVVGVEAGLVVPSKKVKGGEEFGPVQLIEELIHAGEGVAVLDGLGIECPVVDAHTEGTISLAGKEDGRTILRASRPDPAFLEVDGELALELLELSRGHAEGALLWGVGVWFEVDPVERAHVGCCTWFGEGGVEAVEEVVEFGLVRWGEASGGGEWVRGVGGKGGSRGDVDEVR
jgi:hypothetical protein